MRRKHQPPTCAGVILSNDEGSLAVFRFRERRPETFRFARHADMELAAGSRPASFSGS
jgi:hypothetical protein